MCKNCAIESKESEKAFIKLGKRQMATLFIYNAHGAGYFEETEEELLKKKKESALESTLISNASIKKTSKAESALPNAYAKVVKFDIEILEKTFSLTDKIKPEDAVAINDVAQAIPSEVPHSEEASVTLEEPRLPLNEIIEQGIHRNNQSTDTLAEPFLPYTGIGAEVEHHAEKGFKILKCFDGSAISETYLNSFLRKAKIKGEDTEISFLESDKEGGINLAQTFLNLAAKAKNEGKILVIDIETAKGIEKIEVSPDYFYRITQSKYDTKIMKNLIDKAIELASSIKLEESTEIAKEYLYKAAQTLANKAQTFAAKGQERAFVAHKKAKFLPRFFSSKKQNKKEDSLESKDPLEAEDPLEAKETKLKEYLMVLLYSPDTDRKKIQEIMKDIEKVQKEKLDRDKNIAKKPVNSDLEKQERLKELNIVKAEKAFNNILSSLTNDLTKNSKNNSFSLIFEKLFNKKSKILKNKENVKELFLDAFEQNDTKTLQALLTLSENINDLALAPILVHSFFYKIYSDNTLKGKISANNDADPKDLFYQLLEQIYQKDQNALTKCNERNLSAVKYFYEEMKLQPKFIQNLLLYPFAKENIVSESLKLTMAANFAFCNYGSNLSSVCIDYLNYASNFSETSEKNIIFTLIKSASDALSDKKQSLDTKHNVAVFKDCLQIISHIQNVNPKLFEQVNQEGHTVDKVYKKFKELYLQKYPYLATKEEGIEDPEEVTQKFKNSEEFKNICKNLNEAYDKMKEAEAPTTGLWQESLSQLNKPRLTPPSCYTPPPHTK